MLYYLAVDGTVHLRDVPLAGLITRPSHIKGIPGPPRTRVRRAILASADFDGRRKFRRPAQISTARAISLTTTRPRRSYLFASASNVSLGPKEDRVLLTGLHTVADIYCVSCETRLGWKYVEAFEPSQKYKEGRFIVEKIKIIEGNDL